MNPIETKQSRINYWLRHHTDYDVVYHFNGTYGCVHITIVKNLHIERGDGERSSYSYEHVKSWAGQSLEKRLDQVIAYLKIDEWEGSWKWWLSREENMERAQS